MSRQLSFLALGLFICALLSCNGSAVKPPKNIASIAITNGLQNVIPAFIAYRDGDQPWVLPTEKEPGSYELLIENETGNYDLVIICPKSPTTSFQSVAFIATTLSEFKTLSFPCFDPNLSLEMFEITGTVSGFGDAPSVSILGGWDVDVVNGKTGHAFPEDPTYYIETPEGLQSFIAIRNSEPKLILVKHNLMIDSPQRLDFDFDQLGYATELHNVTIKNIQNPRDFGANSGLLAQGTNFLFGYFLESIEYPQLSNEITEAYEAIPPSALKSQWNSIHAQEENPFAGFGSIEKDVTKYFKNPGSGDGLVKRTAKG
jgi:hypothetical protein